MMDAEKINRTIHEWLGRGEDWHEFEWEAGESDCQRCSKNIVDHLDAFPDYTTDLNAVRKAELKCIEELEAENERLREALGHYADDDYWEQSLDGAFNIYIGSHDDTPEQIADGCDVAREALDQAGKLS